MHVTIQTLKDHDAVRAALQNDGWDFQPEEQPNTLRAKHPRVQEESVARWRLNQLGLLTCRLCRIEFLHDVTPN